MDIGSKAYDKWARKTVIVIAGAQSGNYTTVQFPDGTITIVPSRDLVQATSP